MSIVINDENIIALTKYLEASFCAVEMLDRRFNVSERNSRLQTHNNCCHSIVEVMSSRNRELHSTQLFSTTLHQEGYLAIAQRNLMGRVIAFVINPIRNNAAA
ncbi:hypothetical protein D3C80_1981590 [compost metagenome]